jgi:hypothetical protein
MKPTKLHLYNLPDGYWQLAIANFNASGNPDKMHEDQIQALFYAYDWKETPEGYDFWDELVSFLEGQRDLPPLPVEKQHVKEVVVTNVVKRKRKKESDAEGDVQG